MKINEFEKASTALTPIVLNDIEKYVVFAPIKKFSNPAAKDEKQEGAQKQEVQRSFATKMLEALKESANVNISSRI